MSGDAKAERRELLTAQVERDVSQRLHLFMVKIAEHAKRRGRDVTEGDRYRARTLACMNRAERRRHFGTSGPEPYTAGQLASSLKTRRPSSPVRRPGQQPTGERS